MIGAVIFVIIGLVTLGVGINYRVKASKTSKWKSTSAKILKTGLVKVRSSDSYNLVCQIEYSFIIDNEIIIGNKITPYIGIRE